MSWFCLKESKAEIALLLCVVFAMFAFNACGESVDADEAVQYESSSSSKSSSSKARYPESFKPNDEEYPYVGIPRIVIETEYRKAIVDRENEIPAKLQIWGEKESESEVLDLTIRGRGNSSWWYLKRPYAIKFENKVSLFGMPEAKKWVLLANYRDRTLMRNALAFEIARQTEIGWTPQGRFVEIFLNKKFIGNYYLCEKIEGQSNRLDLDSNDYLLEFDDYYDSENKFRTSRKSYPVNIKSPETLSETQFSYIQSFIVSVETVLYSGKLDSLNIENYIDLKSFALYWIVYEITKNGEANHPKSVYMHKRENEPLKMGPVWDFDFVTFIANDGFLIKDALWYKSLIQYPKFKEETKSQWTKNKDKFRKLTSFIDSLTSYTKASNERNFSLWPIVIKNEKYFAGDEEMDFDDAIQTLKKNYTDRLNDLDSLFLAL